MLFSVTPLLNLADSLDTISGLNLILKGSKKNACVPSETLRIETLQEHIDNLLAEGVIS